MVRSRDKGKRGELEARDMVRTHWHAPDCERTAQVSGKFASDILNALDNAHVEVKFHARLGVFRFLEQALKDKQDSEYPVLLLRETGQKRWLVAFPIEDTERFVSDYLRNRNQP